jgi:transposase
MTRFFKYSLGFILFNLQLSTIVNMIAFVFAPRSVCVPYQVFLPITGFRRSLSCGLLSIGRDGLPTILVDYPNKKIFEVAEGKTADGLAHTFKDVPGRERVKSIVLDICDPFKKFAKEFFPSARLVADHFHVIRLLNPMINKARTEITGDQRSNPVRKLLLMNGKRLEYFERRALHQWLDHHPRLKELYNFKEALHGLYRCRGYNRARRALIGILDRMALSELPEIKKLRKTLMKWRVEILNYFITRLTNGRTEGFNNLAKLLQKRAFGFKSFRNYRLRLLSL